MYRYERILLLSLRRLPFSNVIRHDMPSNLADATDGIRTYLAVLGHRTRGQTWNTMILENEAERGNGRLINQGQCIECGVHE